MHRLIPIESFESPDVPVFAVARDGVVRWSNHAATSLFAGDDAPLVGQSCWRCFRLRGPAGGVFCRRDCPILRHETAGPVPTRREVALPAGTADPLRFDLVTFQTSKPCCLEDLVLHVLVPAPDGDAHASPSLESLVSGGGRLHLLTAREMQVLERLASGLDPAAVAAGLDISLVTVRNHIRSILHKLHLHRQVDAILALMGRHGHPGPHVDNQF